MARSSASAKSARKSAASRGTASASLPHAKKSHAKKLRAKKSHAKNLPAKKNTKKTARKKATSKKPASKKTASKKATSKKATTAKKSVALSALDREALAYHVGPPAGKVALAPTKVLDTQHDLALAYSPGVAAPCLEIAKKPSRSYDYTARSNTIAVISNGTAVLGLGNLGALASKPVMEGKAVLFKRFADVDAVDLEVDSEDVDEFIESVAKVATGFGGVNLEDISAPSCFPIEQRLAKRLEIPVFHDDQHGTAIIVLAGILNALDITGRKPATTQVAIVGAGAAAISVANLLRAYGFKQIILCDSVGVLHDAREDLDEWRRPLALRTSKRTLADALKGADVVIGLSAAGAIAPKLLLSMRKNPVLFLLANPVPEVGYDLAKKLRPDAIIATGRSDYPNQVNNVLGFPYIFRGALDVRASRINTAMKLAAAEALAKLTRTDTPEEVDRAYARRLQYGPEYIIPTPFDPRLIRDVPLAVARAALRTGAAGRKPQDLERYAIELTARHDPTVLALQSVFEQVKKSPQRVIFAEGEEATTVRAAWSFAQEGYGVPLLVGKRERVCQTIRTLGMKEDFCRILNAADAPRRQELTERLWKRHQRHGFLYRDARREINRNRNIFSASLLESGEADAMVTGLTRPYHVAYEDVRRVIDADGLDFGLHILLRKGRTLFLADTQLHPDPTPEMVVEIASVAADFARSLGHEPRVALLSFSNFGNPPFARAAVMREAVRLMDSAPRNFAYEGEMEPRVALVEDRVKRHYPFARLDGPANVLVFPSLNASGIAVQLLETLGAGRALGPILFGLKKPVGIVPFDSGIDAMVLSAVFSAYEAILEKEPASASKRSKARKASSGKASSRSSSKSSSRSAGTPRRKT